jgi:hypothetical protein
MCMGSSMLRRAAQPEAAATLAQIRQLRDRHLLAARNGKQMVQLFEAAGPILTGAIRREHDSNELRARIAHFLLHNFKEHTDLEKISQAIAEPGRRALSLLNRLASGKRKDAVEGALNKLVRFIREEITADGSIHAVSKSLSRILEEEYERLGKSK